MEKDIIKSAILAHKIVWQQKQYFLQLAFIPLLIQAFCTVIAYRLQYDIFSLRFILIMLPVYTANAWLIAHILRFLLLGERRNQITDKNDPTRIRAIKATILYSVLITMIQASMLALPAELGIQLITKDWQPNIIEFGLYCMALGALIWAVRLVWLNLPLSINASMAKFLSEIKGYGTSFYLIGIWLLSSLPITILLVLFPAIILESSYETIYELPTFIAVIVMGLRMVSNLIALIIATVAVTYTFSKILEKQGATPIFEQFQRGGK